MQRLGWSPPFPCQMPWSTSIFIYHLSCLPWPRSGIYSMAGQGTPRWMSRYFSCLEDSPSQVCAGSGTDPSKSPKYPKKEDLTLVEPGPRHSVCPEKCPLTPEQKMLKGIKITLSSNIKIPQKEAPQEMLCCLLSTELSEFPDYNWNSLLF